MLKRHAIAETQSKQSLFRSHVQEDHFNFGFENDGDGNSSGVVHARDIVGSHEGAVVGAVGSSKELLQTMLD